MAYTEHPIWPFPHNWAGELLETLEWRTDVLAGQTGKEQRVTRRVSPLRLFETSVLLSGTQLQYFEHWMAAHGGGVFVLPLWQEATRTSGNAAAAASTIPMDTDFLELAAGDLMVLRGATEQSWEAYKVSTALPGIVTLDPATGALASSWPAGTVAYPAILARIDDYARGAKRTDRAVEVTVRFVSAQETTHPSGWYPSTFEGAPVLDLAPDDSEDLSMDYQRLLNTQDNGTGRPDTFDMAARQFKSQAYRWSVIGRQSAKELRDALYWLRGKTRSLWLSTSMDDLKLISNVNTADTSITIRNVKYASLEMHTRNRAVIRVQLHSGIVLYNRVTLAAEIDANSEVLAVGTPWPSAFTPDEVARISYLFHVRLDQDTVEISHPTDTAGVSHCMVVWKEAGGEALPIVVAPVVPVDQELWKSTVVEVAIPAGVGFYGEEMIALPDRNELVIFGYPENGWASRYIRLSGVDGSYIADIAQPPPPANIIASDRASSPTLPKDVCYDGAGAIWFVAMEIDAAQDVVYNPDGNYGGIARIDTTTWEITYAPTVDVPISVPDIAATTLRCEFRYPHANPYNHDVWVWANGGVQALAKLNKAGPINIPAQIIYIDRPYVSTVSEFGGVPDMPERAASTYDGPYLTDSRLVFTSATTAYAISYVHTATAPGGVYNNSVAGLFRIDLATGYTYYQFNLTRPSSHDLQDVSVRISHFDDASQTLWFVGEFGVYSWVIGSNPAGMRDFPFRRDVEITPWGTMGEQYLPQTYYAMDEDLFNTYANPFGGKLWSGRACSVTSANSKTSYAGAINHLGTPRPRMPFMESIDTRDGVSTNAVLVADRPATPNTSSTFVGDVPVFLSADLWWSFGGSSGGYGAPEKHTFYRAEKTGVRLKPPIARYVRLTVYQIGDTQRSAGSYPNKPPQGYPLAIQQLEVRGIRMGLPHSIAAITASSTNPTFPIANLTDGDIVDPAHTWKAAGTGLPVTLDIDLGQLQTVYEVAIWPMNDRGALEYGATAEQPGAWSAPWDFAIDVSVDGVTWTRQRDYFNIGNWYLGITPGVDRAACRAFDAF